jgi:hypothetical protein
VSELFVEVSSIESHFESLSDPRHTRNRKHLLVDIVVISIRERVYQAPFRAQSVSGVRWGREKGADVARARCFGPS